MRVCKKCNIQKSISHFRPSDSYKGKIYYASACRPCENKANAERNKLHPEWWKNHRKRHRAEWQRYQKEWLKKRVEKLGLPVSHAVGVGLELAAVVYRRAQYQCDACHSRENLTIHHKDGNGRHNFERGLPVNNDLSNLMVLCRKCHGSIDGKKTYSNRKGR